MTNYKSRLYSIVKRGADITGAILILGISAPAFVVFSALIKTESPGPVFYVHDRVGFRGEHIRVLKFRSMKVGSDDLEAVLNDEDLERYYQEYRLTDDPRVTSIGRFLRKTSLDELPQLINVLEGSMSLVGPRPVVEKELENYSPEERCIFLSVKPGITGLWQVSDRNETTYQSGKRQQLELYYVKNVSLLSDICILLKTPVALLKRGV